MSADKKKPVIAVAGNPNSGKTTLFNALTGSHQRVGNWPGVTVEKKSGDAMLGGLPVEIVDLPGIYSLSSHSEDERVSRDYLLSGDADFVVNIVDASNLERNLFLTLNILEMKVPTVVVLNMMDLAAKKGIAVDAAKLSAELGVPVFAVNATKKGDVELLAEKLALESLSIAAPEFEVPYPPAVALAAAALQAKLVQVSREVSSDARWVALKILEEDRHLTALALDSQSLSRTEIDDVLASIERETGDSADAAIASAKYDAISGLSRTCVSGTGKKAGSGGKLDRIVLNRFLGIPLFLLVMYLMFALVINVGGAFIDFFDILFGAVFVDGFGHLLGMAGAPEWLIALLAGGIGAGIQTVSTFVPIMFMMFFLLSLLEDSGYMARAAFVMDRALRAIGLPGKAFIPMIVGFGCTVPAIMATRTLENKRDRYLTVFMAPFMSCGARLPVYALFGAAFFGKNADLVVLSIYLAGIALAVLTGIILKNTLFKGEPAPFVMELPPYHVPRIGSTLRHSWLRLKSFVVRAGKVIVLVVAILGLLNSIGADGSFGNEDSSNSVLSAVGKTFTPVFGPMGITQDNWPATVGMFTGLFAKEAVVGTLNGLYGQLEAQEASADAAGAVAAGSAASSADDSAEAASGDPGFDFGAAVVEAFASIPASFAGLADSVLDPLGLSIISGNEAAVAEEIEADAGIFAVMRDRFGNNKHAAYAYLLFILVYFPCIAALGAIIRELGRFYGWLCIVYLTVLAWITATLYYQIAYAHQALWIAVPVVLFLCMIALFNVIRNKTDPVGTR